MELKRVLQNLRSLGSDSSSVEEPPSTCILQNNSMGLCSFEDINFSDEESEMEVTSTSEALIPHLDAACPAPVRQNWSLRNASQPVCNSKNVSMASPVITTKSNASQDTNLTTPIVYSSPIFNQQRFPGPAGCLPKLPSSQCLDSIQLSMPSLIPPLTPSPVTTPRRLRSAIKSSCTNGIDTCSNNTNTGSVTNDDFLHPPWTTMIKDLDSFLNQSDTFTLAFVKRSAINHQLVGGKVARLRVLVKSVTNHVKSMNALVKDETGEMLATVHQRVWELYKDEWSVGCCMILKQVSIISPTPRKHYLNITLDNIVRLYSVNKKLFSSPDGRFKDRTNVSTTDRYAILQRHNKMQGDDCINHVMKDEVNNNNLLKSIDQAHVRLPPHDFAKQNTQPPPSSYNQRPPSSRPMSFIDIEDDLDDLFKDIDASISDI